MYRTKKEKQTGSMPSLLCAPSAHSSPLGFAPANTQKQDPNPSPRITGARCDSAGESGQDV